MRDVRYRYWCKIEQKMYDKAYIEEHLNLAFMSELIGAAQERYVFLQYTGLIDKNGQEIFEGDFLSNGEHINWQVGFHEGAFKVVLTNPASSDKWNLDREMASTREIIGNIYENKELRDNW